MIYNLRHECIHNKALSDMIACEMRIQWISTVMQQMKVRIVKQEGGLLLVRQRHGNHFSAATISKQQQRHCWKRCFLHSQCQDYIKRTKTEKSSLVEAAT
jgi:uncharacterized protein (DUF2252 family)